MAAEPARPDPARPASPALARAPIAGAVAPDPLAPLAEFAAAAQVDEAVLSRRRRHWQRQVAAESSTFTAVLAECADVGVAVTVETPARAFTGRIAECGPDHLALVALDGVWLVPYPSIEGLHLSTAVAGTATRAAGGPTFLARLAAAAGARDQVTIVTRRGEAQGELCELGRDFARLRVDRGTSRSWHYVPQASIVAVQIARAS